MEKRSEWFAVVAFLLAAISGFFVVYLASVPAIFFTDNLKAATPVALQVMCFSFSYLLFWSLRSVFRVGRRLIERTFFIFVVLLVGYAVYFFLNSEKNGWEVIVHAAILPSLAVGAIFGSGVYRRGVLR